MIWRPKKPEDFRYNRIFLVAFIFLTSLAFGILILMLGADYAGKVTLPSIGALVPLWYLAQPLARTITINTRIRSQGNIMSSPNNTNNEFDWHYYEFSSEQCLDRLLEICDEAGKIGNFFTRPIGIDHSTQERLAETLTDWVNRSRVPGYCGFKLAEEGIILIQQITVCITVLREIYEKNGNSEGIAKLDQMKIYCDKFEPIILRSLDNLAPYQNLNGREIISAYMNRANKAKG